MGRRAFETSLAVAFALHALGLALLPRAQRDTARHASTPRTEELEIELASGAPAARSAGQARSSTATRATGPRVAMVPRPGSTTATEAIAPPPEPAPTHATGVPEAPPGPAPHGAAPRGATPAQLGIGFDNPLLGRSPGSLKAAPHRRRNVAPGIARSLAQAQADHDAHVGIGPQGPVVGALEVATRAAPGPMNGHALFSVDVDASGRMTDIRVLEVSSEFAAWKAIAKRTAAALARRKLKPPSGGRAVRMTVKVVARNQMPSGADPGFAVDLAGIPLKKGAGKKSARLSILPLPKAQKVHVTTPEGSYDLPWVTTPIPGLALAADPADIGATPRRMVHAHVVSTTVL